MNEPLPTPVSTSWSPLLEGALAEQAQTALADIAQALPTTCAHSGLAGGESGIALFYAYLNRAQPGCGWQERALTHMDQVVTSLGEGVIGPTLYSGFTGIAWALDHLQGQLWEAGDEDPNEDIDAALEDHLGRSPWRGDYDLISGLVGYGLYGLDRVQRPSGRRILLRVLEQLELTKSTVGSGFSWHTAPELLPQWQRDLSPEGYFNLGLAHGVPAVISLLAQAHSAGIEPERTLPLLEGAVAWLLEQKNPEGTGSFFGTTVPTNRPPDRSPSRLAWCYGDLGLCVALLQAARCVGRADWEAQSLDIARSAARRPTSEGGTRDAALCHGNAGNAHLFNRLWQATGEPCFREAALAWFEAALALREPGRGVAGFSSWMPGQALDKDRDPWVASEGFLEGAAGIGLALMAGLYPTLPSWDGILMVSVPPITTTQR